MLKEFLFAVWFFAPAGAANTFPVFTANIPGLRKLNAPIDFGRSFRGQRIFGAHKTWRGFATGVLMATVTLALQQLLVRHYAWARTLTSQVDYASFPTLVLGPLFGVGVIGGDAIESFFKRQRHIPPGYGWFPFDQTDYIIGGAIATAPFVRLDFVQYAWLIAFWVLAQMLASYIGYLLKLKEHPI